ncbi:MAG: hypothetical protein LBV43_04115 [Prevotella sp.]|jgi:hypothetical protein|nr:hypothetical protein [Prevotella sp.]
MRKFFFYYLPAVATIVGLALTIFFYFFQKDYAQIEVKSLDKTQLTQVPNTEGLSVQYIYQDSIVNNLWKIRYVISNTGNKTIISTGTLKNILLDKLSIHFRDSVKLLSVAINDKNFPVSIENEKSCVYLDFKQWKKNEFIDIIAIVENFDSIGPFVFIDERDIIDAKIIFSEYKPDEVKIDAKLIEYLPGGMANILKWIIIFVIIIFDIALMFAIYKQYKEDPNINKGVKIITFFTWLIVALIFSLPILWIL